MEDFLAGAGLGIIIITLLNGYILFMNFRLRDEMMDMDIPMDIRFAKGEMERFVETTIQRTEIDVIIDGTPHRAEVKIIGGKVVKDEH